LRRRATFTLTFTLAVLLLLIFAGINYFKPHTSVLPFHCLTFSRYELSHDANEKIDFAVSQDLRFVDLNSGYLLLNGKVTSGDKVTILNRRIVLNNGHEIEDNTYRYKIRTIITSTNDTTPDTVFNRLLAEITLDPTYVQLDITQLDDSTYLIGAPLAYLFSCQKY